MSWIFIADDGEQVHYDVPPRVAELEQKLLHERKTGFIDGQMNTEIKMAGIVSELREQLEELRAHSELLREALSGAADGFEGAAAGHGVNFFAYAEDIRALLKQGGEG